jgi:hypothetical protein
MLVHSRLCGTLIGKGGATIRSFNEDSKATFNISPPPAMPGAPAAMPTQRAEPGVARVDAAKRLHWWGYAG